jgi:hypothetical protein
MEFQGLPSYANHCSFRAEVITVSQVAQALGGSGETVRKRLASGDLQGEQQTNRRWRVAKASVDASLAKLGKRAPSRSATRQASPQNSND